jgi:putative peptidoglycan lipid II flippase
MIAGALVTSLGTLVSRVLGLVRDMATASLLGLAGGGVMDAFVVAFRIPNLFRSLLGEGALSACYLPVFTAVWQRDRQAAWQLTSVVLAWLTVALSALVLLGEAIYGAVWFSSEPGGRGQLLAGLGATLLPYMLLICVAAQLTATLHALGHFGVPALTPTLLNVCWLAAVWFVAPAFASDRASQAYAIAAAILVAGVLQVGVQLPPLWKQGFRFDYRPSAVVEPLRRIAHSMAPMVLGLGITQINTFLDSMIAWGLAAPVDGPRQIGWLGGIRYPLEQGAAAAIYYGERMYWLPLGLLGMAVATAIFPLLSRHAARGQLDRLADDLTAGLRLVVCLGVPAGVGLVLLSAPLTRVLFERGEFTAADTLRAARVVAAYGAGVWAFCAMPVIVRGFYAVGDFLSPARVAIVVVALNLALNLALIWPLAEAGLAVATSLCASLQVIWLTAAFSRRHAGLAWRSLLATAARTLAATLAMAATVYAVLAVLPNASGLASDVVRLIAALAVAGIVYPAVLWLVGGRELAMIVRRQRPPEP